MDFDFNINTYFPEKISLVNRETLQKEQRKINSSYKYLQFVVDCLGKRSAKAQQLTGSITSLQKSQINGHNIYILKETDSNSGFGSVIGFIKVGRKQLFVLDHDGNHNEMCPLCVLDFYIHESQQRKGCGLSLFKHMLTRENVLPQHLAIDRPSHKFICFLKKHFNLWATIPQVNNFVVFDGFFKNRSDFTPTKNGRRSRNFSYCRPLSRAVSDDVIKRTRKTESSTFTTNLNGIRPASSTEMPSNDFISSRVRRKKWNLDGTPFSGNARPPPTAGPHLFSRYMLNSQDRTTAKPPIPSNHRGFRCKTDRNMGNPHSKEKHDGGGKNNGMNFTSDVLTTQQTGLIPNEQVEAEKMSSQPHTMATDQTSNHTADHTTAEKPKIYSKPSDMLLELKNKDEQFLLNTSNQLPSVYSKSWNRRQLKEIGSSWNVLGVPSRPFWSNQ